MFGLVFLTKGIDSLGIDSFKDVVDFTEPPTWPDFHKVGIDIARGIHDSDLTFFTVDLINMDEKGSVGRNLADEEVFLIHGWGMGIFILLANVLFKG